MLSRRQFLQQGAAGLSGLSFVSLSSQSPLLLAQAAKAAKVADRNDHILVLIELSGGNDGLNTLVPCTSEAYYRQRRTLALPKNTLHMLSDDCGLHPRMGALAELFHDGNVAFVQGVGYPQPDRSHFRSMEIWHTASTAARTRTGWLGRCLETMSAATRGDLPALAIATGLPQALQSDVISVPAIEQIEGVQETLVSAGPRSDLLRKLGTNSSQTGGPVPFIVRQSQAMYRAADLLQGAQSNYASSIAYPESPVAQRLRKVAQVLSADLGVRVFFVSQDGYDTHATQAEQHGQLLEQLSAAIKAFLEDVDHMGLAERVIVAAFSEFGRRVEENASRGTDHGAASCMLLAGQQVRGGLFGSYPSLDELDEGDLVFSTDFRAVYATLLEQWLGCPSAPLLGARFPQLDLIRSGA